jgi:4a-hydroxytetrahydrobiopterin dehydratase
LEELPRHQLSDSELRDALRELPGWTSNKARLEKEFRFQDFSRAFGFMTKGALVAEAMAHHPELTNIYNKVSFKLWTHTHKGVTNLDVDLARKIEALVKESQGHQ